MRLDLIHVQTRLWVGQQPSDQVLRLAREMDVVREVEVCIRKRTNQPKVGKVSLRPHRTGRGEGRRLTVLPVNDLPVGVVRVLGAERRVPDETFEHDRSERPPIALVRVPLLQEDLGRDLEENKLQARGSARDPKGGMNETERGAYVVWCSDGTVRLENDMRKDNRSASRTRSGTSKAHQTDQLPPVRLPRRDRIL
jgi:hypothetical protein